jgi:hypothetical protein
MTVKPETNFWKNVKKLLASGKEHYLVSRIESYATPGFPDCVVFHRDTGFFTLELKIARRNKKGIGKVLVSPLQLAWNTMHMISGAPVYTLVLDPGHRTVKLFTSEKLLELREKDYDSVTGALYEGPLVNLQLHKLLKLPNSR